MGKKRIRFGSRGKKTEDFVDPDKDPYSYLKRYILEENYKDWFERNYPDNTIYGAVGLNEWDYNEMKKKLSANQDTVEDTSKLEPEPESEPESEPEPEPELAVLVYSSSSLLEHEETSTAMLTIRINLDNKLFKLFFFRKY